MGARISGNGRSFSETFARDFDLIVWFALPTAGDALAEDLAAGDDLIDDLDAPVAPRDFDEPPFFRRAEEPFEEPLDFFVVAEAFALRRSRR